MIFVSTGGVRNRSAWQTSLQFFEAGLQAIELSGGRPEQNQLIELKRLQSQVHFQVHNYFPPPSKPFVFNLASLNQETSQRSFEHVKTAMQWSLELERPVYSFHAGFLLDPKISELGERISNIELFDRKQAFSAFLDQVNNLAEKARQQGVSLLIENNVLSANNYHEFGSNPFLMVTAEECVHVMKNTPKNVNLLIDVAHLKVSACSLQFDPIEFLLKCDPWIRAYHLSDNNGKSDNNEPVTTDSWFWPYINRDLDYYSLEIYNVEHSHLLQQLLLAQQKLGKLNG